MGLSPNKTTAVIAVLKLQENQDFYKKVQIGRSVFNRYSQKAIDAMAAALKERSIDEIWQEYQSKNSRKRKRG
jgi:hypothetical protein